LTITPVQKALARPRPASSRIFPLIKMHRKVACS